MDADQLIRTFVRWGSLRAAFHGGWWTVTALYLVVVAQLSPFELIILGTAQGVVTLAAEIPTGVMADTISRKWSLVVAHALMAAGMILTGLTTEAWVLAVAMGLWGLGWAFTSGAEVAWITDELNQPGRIASVLTRSARWRVVWTAIGMLVFGGLAWLTTMAAAITASGVAMGLLGLYVVASFPERNFRRSPDRRVSASIRILTTGLKLAGGDRLVLLILASALLFNGAAEGLGRLYAKRLVDLGFPQEPDPILWYTGLALVVVAVAAVGLRIVESRINTAGASRLMYSGACALGVVGAVLLALASDDAFAAAGLLLFNGIAGPVTRSVGDILVNERATSEVRATIHSFVSQAESVGEILFGLGLGLVARTAGVPAAFIGAAVLTAIAGLLVLRERPSKTP